MSKSKEKIYIYGTGGLSRVVAEIIKANNKFKIAGYIDDNVGINNYGIQSISSEYFLNKVKKANIVIALGENIERKKIYKKFDTNNYKFPNVISKYANIAKNTKIGIGNIILSSSAINNSSIIENFCILNSQSLLEHDCIMNSFSQISPSTIICGGCKIKEGAFVGANSTVIQNITIGNWSVIGASSLVLKNIKQKTLNFGSPSKNIKKINNNYKVFKLNA